MIIGSAFYYTHTKEGKLVRQSGFDRNIPAGSVMRCGPHEVAVWGTSDGRHQVITAGNRVKKTALAKGVSIEEFVQALLHTQD